MVLLVRYGELALKSTYVRRHLEDRLAANVQDMFAANGVECVVKVVRGRLFVHAEDEAAAVRLLRRVFGIVSVSPAKEVKSDLETLVREVVAYAKDVLRPGTSFAIRARRSGEHPYTSQEFAKVAGKAIQDAISALAVNLTAPNHEIHVEIRGPRAYLFREIVDGPGGLPLGSQGEVLAVIRDEADLVAAWLLMRRGCRTRVAGPAPLLAALRAWDPRLETVPSERISDVSNRTAVRAAAILESSQDEDAQGEPFLLRPLAGLTDDEVARLAEQIRAA